MTDIDTDLITKNAKAIIYENHGKLSDYLGFKKDLDAWIHSGRQPVKGLPGEGYIVSGVTDGLNQVFALYHRIGVFDGEYGYSQQVIGDRVTTDLTDCDAIVLSHPFSADGMSSHARLALADQHDKPIFVDCAFFGVCGDVSFDFSPYKNVRAVCFSLSKSFGTGHRRTGMLYTNDAYPAKIYETWNYHFTAGAEFHYGVLDRYSPDHMFDTYREKQLRICEKLNVEPSDTVIFGLDHTERFKHFKRGYVNRLCISDLLVI